MPEPSPTSTPQPVTPKTVALAVLMLVILLTGWTLPGALFWIAVAALYLLWRQLIRLLEKAG